MKQQRFMAFWCADFHSSDPSKKWNFLFVSFHVAIASIEHCSQLSIKLTKQIDKWSKLAVAFSLVLYVDSSIEKFPITREKQYRISAKKCDGKTMEAQMKHYRELNADVFYVIKTRSNNTDRWKMCTALVRLQFLVHGKMRKYGWQISREMKCRKLGNWTEKRLRNMKEQCERQQRERETNRKSERVEEVAIEWGRKKREEQRETQRIAIWKKMELELME